MGTTSKRKNPHAGHRARMRERFLAGGFDNYREHEVLEQILYNALPRVNTNETAHMLLSEHESLLDLLYAHRGDHMNIHGIGERSADYIASIIPRISEKICVHFRDRGELSIYDIAFLGDWFLRYKPEDVVGIIICDTERRFLDFRYIDIILDDGEFDPYATGDMIAKKLSAERYFILTKKENPLLNREGLLTLRDYTSRLASFMCDAYGLDGFRPISYIYKSNE